MSATVTKFSRRRKRPGASQPAAPPPAAPPPPPAPAPADKHSVIGQLLGEHCARLLAAGFLQHEVAAALLGSSVAVCAALPDRTLAINYLRALPKPPATLPKAAHGFWRELARKLDEAGVMTEVDRQALALTCSALAEHQAAAAVVAELGATYEARTEAGAIRYRERPQVRIAADSWRRAMRGLAEFGLTPASRGRVEPAMSSAANPFAGRQ